MKRVLDLGSMVVSLIILAIYAAVMLGVAPVPNDGELRLLDASVTLVIGYWLGSSRGSVEKNALLAASYPAPPVVEPPASPPPA